MASHDNEGAALGSLCVIAVRIRDARRALATLDPESRALLDLSLRRGLEDDDIANVLRVD
jgi:DNA-directed RNA polymerase specialized sigma24 family protein